MKKIKILPSILMLVACVAILGVGVFAVAPTQNTISGSITINSTNPEVIISAYHHNEDGSLNTESPIIENVSVRSGIDINFGSLTFDTSKANTEADLESLTKKITIRLQNPSSTRLGVYFSDHEVTGDAVDGDVKTTIPLTTSDDQTGLVSATLTDYRVLFEKAGEVNGKIDMCITFNLLKFATGEGDLNIDISSETNAMYLNVEECNTSLAPAVVGTTGQLTQEQVSDVSGFVQIANGVTSIGDNAFNGKNIDTVLIPETVTSLGEAVFSFSKLKSIVIPSSITSIGSQTFLMCSSLTNIELLANISEISGGMFEQCTILTSIKIPETVTIISDYAFNECYMLSDIEIPSGVTSIGSSAFYTCSSLSSIEIPSSVTSIGSEAFSACYSLNKIIVKAGTATTFDCYLPGDYTLNGTTACTYETAIARVADKDNVYVKI